MIFVDRHFDFLVIHYTYNLDISVSAKRNQKNKTGGSQNEINIERNQGA